jgi:hypothetical protein
MNTPNRPQPLPTSTEHQARLEALRKLREDMLALQARLEYARLLRRLKAR